MTPTPATTAISGAAGRFEHEDKLAALARRDPGAADALACEAVATFTG